MIRYFQLILLLIVLFPKFSQSQKSLSIEDTTYIYYDKNFQVIDAATKGDTAKLKAFLEIGGNVNSTTWDRVTPLMFAAQNGHLRIVEMLIDSGALINAKPYSQIDALLGATIAGHVHIADTLILNGAKVDTRNLDGVSPLMYAAAYDHYILCDVLIFYGAKINTTDNYGNRPIHFASFYGNTDIVELLIRNGAKIDEKENEGFTSLMIASQNGHNEVVKLLTESGSPVNQMNDDNVTPLTLAIYKRQYETTEYLLSNGANPNHIIANKVNLYELARDVAGKPMTGLLEEYGAKPVRKYSLDKLFFNFDMNWNSKDFMLGGSMTLLESKFGFMADIGYRTRPAERSIFYELDPQTFYQFWEKRSLIFLGAGKRFEFVSPGPRKYFGAFATVNAGYTYGNFRGSDKKPNDKILFIPKAGLFYDNNMFALKVNYEYMKLKNTEVPPHRFTFSIGLKINLLKTRIRTKDEPYL